MHVIHPVFHVSMLEPSTLNSIPDHVWLHCGSDGRLQHGSNRWLHCGSDGWLHYGDGDFNRDVGVQGIRGSRQCGGMYGGLLGRNMFRELWLGYSMGKVGWWRCPLTLPANVWNSCPATPLSRSKLNTLPAEQPHSSLSNGSPVTVRY